MMLVIENAPIRHGDKVVYGMDVYHVLRIYFRSGKLVASLRNTLEAETIVIAPVKHLGKLAR